MSISSLEQGLQSRLWVIDIPLSLRKEFSSLVAKWSRCSGVEWTIKRLKSLKVDLYRRRAGLPPLTDWVRKNRKGDFAGCIGGLFRYADKSDKNFRKVVQTLMCYTVFTYSKPTTSQVEKFTTALSAAPPPPWGHLDDFSKVIKQKFGVQTVDRDKEVSLLYFRGSPSKRKPSVGDRSVAQCDNTLDDADLFCRSEWGLDLLCRYKDLFDPVLEGLVLRSWKARFYALKRTKRPTEIRGGKIAFIQEAGGKLRSVASPYLLYQLALRHFGDAVYGLARRLPWDCTHDQSKPVHTLMDALRVGQTVHSVDLSSATDYFPLEVQVSVMRAIYGNIPDISLFEEISRSTWKSPVGDIRWNRGQPLGLFPSFAVFTVTHGLLLWYLNGCRWNKDFFVLGDDVVILDDSLHRRYLDTLKEWGCPYSPEKSLSSDQICEFAGKVITSNFVTPQFKWRRMSNDNFVDLCRQLGQRSRILLTKRQREVFDLIRHCSMPMGLGYSYQGSSLGALESNTLKTFGPHRKKVLDSLVDQTRLAFEVHYGNSATTELESRRQQVVRNEVSLASFLASAAAFDKKVCEVLGRLLPWFMTNCHDPKHYSGVPGALGNSELPPAQLLPSRRTVLDRYRTLLDLE